jgi:hypothetical protein
MNIQTQLNVILDSFLAFEEIHATLEDNSIPMGIILFAMDEMGYPLNKTYELLRILNEKKLIYTVDYKLYLTEEGRKAALKIRNIMKNLSRN